jgi:hypothetical protein
MDLGLDQHMDRLKEQLAIPVELRKQRIELQQALTTLEQSELLSARDAEEGDKAAIYLPILEAKDAAGKTRYGNDDARDAALKVALRADEFYQGSLTRRRKAEALQAELKTKIAEIDEQIKTQAETCWGLRKLIDGGVAVINAVCTLDAPKLPTQIPLVITGALPASIPLVAPATLPVIHLVPTKEAA